MTVYIDQARNPYRGMIMGHMIADNILDLFDMAKIIGMRAEWFQPGSFPHFDVSVTRRRLAIQNNAIIVDRRSLVQHMRQYRERLKEDENESRALALLIKTPSFRLVTQLRSGQR
tara:strand:- start:145 stop:489 length:345 start_codon:yes stop_codon:yes gene_type:complete